MRTSRLIILVLLFIFSCRSNKEQKLFELLDDTGIDFANNIQSTKDFNVFSYRNFYNGGGVAIADLNNDGLSDVFLTANMGPNKLYFNKGNLKFEDVSERAGFGNKEEWSTGVAIVDINSDGWLDIYVCNAGYIDQRSPVNKLFINNRDGTFIEKAEEYGLTNKGGYCTHAAFFDYDKDGDLDVFIINNSFIPVNTLNYANKRSLRASEWPVQDFLKGGGDRLLRNDSGRFTDVSEEAGIYGSLISFGLGVTVGDVNGDLYPDVYVSNDFFERDYLYINQKNGKFTEELEKWMQHISLSSMGADIADVNNDGYPDIFTTDMLPDDEYRLKTTASFENIDVYRLKQNTGFYHQYMQNTLQVNNRNGKFLETAYFSGVAASDWSWGALIFDADNDGLSDIYVSNGIYNDVTDQDFIDFFADEVVQKMVMTGKKEEVEMMISKMPSRPILNKFFRNKGELRFSDSGDSCGFTQKSFSNGAAYGDLDNDGDLDLVVNNVNEKAFVYRNNSQQNNYIGFQLRINGTNTYAVGSTVKFYLGNEIISRELIPSRGFQSSIDYKILAGLGKDRIPDSVMIFWPDQTTTRLVSPAVNKVHLITQESKSEADPIKEISLTTLLVQKDIMMDAHKEDDYIDFYAERNIPMMVSKEGPKAAVGDVNGDGLDDVYIGGASGQSGKLYIQSSGSFTYKNVAAFEKFSGSEDVAALLFDCDGDGDKDLFVGAGGNNRPAGSPEYDHRLFRNDGKGNFTHDASAFPKNGNNCGVVAHHDFDGDGDEDLFIGSRSVPQNYGVTPKSFIYINDGNGKFTDVTEKLNKDIANVGLVTGAAWADINGDKRKELIIAGEWMPPRIFSFDGTKFIELKNSLGGLNGWWHTLLTEDVDDDGDTDILLGNSGENCYLRGYKGSPLKMWISDFDDNGVMDKIITRTVNKRDVPVFMKRELTEQIPSLKKQNLRHENYATKTIQDLFPSEKLKQAEVKTIDFMLSVIALNDGKGNFSIQHFPSMVQLSCVNAILCMDIDGDGKKDIVMGGNEFGFLPQFSRLDASFGHVLLNRGNARFDWIEPSHSGLQLSGMIRDIKKITSNNSTSILVLQNNERPVWYSYPKK